jgi:hypothetical protein
MAPKVKQGYALPWDSNINFFLKINNSNSLAKKKNGEASMNALRDIFFGKVKNDLVETNM